MRFASSEIESVAAPSPAAGTRRIRLSYDNKVSEKSAKQLVYELRPEWETDEGELEIVKFTDGITNTLLKLAKKDPKRSSADIEADSILMRAYGNNTEILIDRDREAKSHALLAARGLAPALLARFDNGLLYEYIVGQVCTPSDLIREPVWRGVAAKLAEWHARLPVDATPDRKPLVNGTNGSHSINGSNSINGSHSSNGVNGVNGHASHEMSPMGDDCKPSEAILSRSPSPNIWSVMQKWVLALPNNTQEEKSRRQLLQKELERSFEELDSKTAIGHDGFVFGHCDLLSANVIMLPGSGSSLASEGREDVAFIDYEYAIPCAAAFDIANHFAEWGGYDCDYNMLPTRRVRREFLKEYLTSYSAHTTQPSDDAQLAQLFDEIDGYRGMPGLYWGIWALIQATISQINFDYASYAEVRLGEYWAWREATDESSGKTGSQLPLRERRWAQET